MKIGARSKSLGKIILFLLYMESFKTVAVKIYRELRDVTDLVSQNMQCDLIRRSFYQNGRCRCSSLSSIVSTDTGKLECIGDQFIGSRSKYT